MKRFLLLLVLYLLFSESFAQTKYSGEWYFDTIARSPLDSYNKLSFNYTPMTYPLGEQAAYYVKFKEFDQLEKFAKEVPKDKVRGIEFNTSMESFPSDSTLQILANFPNLDIIQFSSGSLFNRFPQKTQHFPAFVTELTQVKVLSFYFHVDFSMDNLAMYTQQMPQLEGLFFISLYDSIGAEVLDHPSLTSILLTSTNFLGQELPRNPRIKNLGLLSSKQDRNINTSMEQLKAFPNLSSLYLDHARLEGTGYFDQVKGIQKLEIKLLDTLIHTNFYEELTTLQQLEKLDIFHELNGNQNLSPIGKLTQLKQLSLSRINSLKEVDFLSSLKNLEDLSFSENQLSMENFRFSALPQLKSLNISYCTGLQLHAEAFNNPNLEMLMLTSNKLKELPSLSSLTKLKTLDLSSNFLSSFELSDLNSPDIETLTLSGNSLKFIWLDLSNFPKLKHLEASQNLIEKITDSYRVNTSLELLNLESNRLEFVPSLENFKNLRILNVNFNQLVELPRGMHHLKTLLAMDQGILQQEGSPKIKTLKSLSKDFEQLTQLEEIHLRGNHQVNLAPLWKCLANMPPNHPLSLDLRDMESMSLPEGDFWNTMNWGSLDLTENRIPNIPQSWSKGLNFDWLGLGKIISLPKTHGSFMFNSPKSFQVFLDAHGFEANLDGINNEEYIEAIQYLMRRYLPNDAPEIIFGLYNKAYSRDPQLTEKKLKYPL